MKYENGFEKKITEEKKAKGEKLDWYEDYEHFNMEPTDELIEKRKKEEEELKLRQQERLEKLRKMAEDGKIYIKE